MSIGRRIKERRKQLGLSADALSERLGKDRSTIYRYEKGDIENLPLDILEPIANTLRTTPQYLMGWEENTADFVFYNNFVRLCIQNGKKPTAVADEMGFAKSAVNRWKSGSAPTDATVFRVASYFGVSPESLLQGSESDLAQEIPLSMDNKKIFAENLKRQMEINGKTRREVCDALGLNYYTFSDWINGKKYPRMYKVEALANYFGVLKSDLIERKDPASHMSSESERLLVEANSLFEQLSPQLQEVILALLREIVGSKKNNDEK